MADEYKAACADCNHQFKFIQGGIMFGFETPEISTEKFNTFHQINMTSGKSPAEKM